MTILSEHQSLLFNAQLPQLSAQALDDFLRAALAEDMPSGDITTDNLITESIQTTATIISKQPLVVSGILVAKRVFELVDPSLQITLSKDDTDTVGGNTPLMLIEGNAASILKAERVALNLLQHLCGIATLTYQYAATISRTKAQITHTRKTLPGLRALENQAVIDGGGVPHRQSLSEAVMIKDNHLLACGGNIKQAVEKIRQQTKAPIIVECDTLEQVEQALEAKVERILLDNMNLEQLRWAVERINGQCQVEASGNVTLKTVSDIAKTGVDIISTSQITLSAPAADIGLDFL
jgi:nicotinate-nucleotide pyrophosphorylase (carboxylating)